jgi:hypothetical protein
VRLAESMHSVRQSLCLSWQKLITWNPAQIRYRTKRFDDTGVGRWCGFDASLAPSAPLGIPDSETIDTVALMDGAATRDGIAAAAGLGSADAETSEDLCIWCRNAQGSHDPNSISSSSILSPPHLPEIQLVFQHRWETQ